MPINTISSDELHSLREGGRSVNLIDVRTPAEFREVHVPGARSIPLDRLDPSSLPLANEPAPAGPLYLICRSGNRARQACERLAAAGCPDVVIVEGGTLAWEQAGLPVVRGRKTIALERQVRIAAGSLVFVGAVLALVVHPWFAALPAFVGAGLVFAGVTDTCGMGLLLARMPWNQAGTDGAACSSEASGRGADAALSVPEGKP